MSDKNLLPVQELRSRITRLFGEFERVEQKNTALATEVETLQNRVKEYEQQLADITDKYENLKLAKGFESGFDDSRIVRQKINKLVREIDKCVALLNG